MSDNVNQYKCVNCTAPLEFSPNTQTWDCEYCFSKFNKEDLDSSTPVQSYNAETSIEMNTYNCSNCSAELVLDSTMSASVCVFCKSPSIITSRLSGEFEPRYIIPFRITKEKAQEIYHAKVRKKIFAPTNFKQNEELESVEGVYAPYWLYDCHIDGDITCSATKKKVWRAGDYRYTKTKYYNVYRKGSMEYTKIPVDGSTKLDDKLMSLIEPFDYQALTDFSPHYMSGFMAEKYDRNKDECLQNIKERVTGEINKKLKADVRGYTSVTTKHKSSNLTNYEGNYALLPVYLIVEKHDGKDYLFAINGQTGKMVGQVPVSKQKVLQFFLAASLITWLIYVLGGALLG